MRNVLLLLGLGLMLMGCDPVTTQQANSAVGSALSTVRQVQAYTIQACKYEPIAASVISLANTMAGATVGAVGGAICNAVTTNPLAEGDKPGYYKAAKVNGVTIKGKFVK